MKKALLILACAAIAGCWCDYEHHTDVLAATRDPLFVQWLSQNDLVVSCVSCGCDCSIIYVWKLVKDGGVK